MKKKWLPFIFFYFIGTSTFAQEDTDSIFNIAIESAKNQDYATAILESKKALETDNSRADITTFIANVYAWDKNYEVALEYIQVSFKKGPFNSELYDAWLNILLWSEKYESIVPTTELAKSNGYLDTENIGLKKMLAYKFLKQYTEGLSFIQNNPVLLENEQIKNLYEEMLALNRQKVLSAFYSVDLFNEMPAQHLAYIDYSFKINKHTLITRLNYANRFNTEDIQIEADYYHSLSNGSYIYSNYGVGINQTLFPAHRLGLEYYSPAFKSIETSIGGRYLHSDVKDVLIATGHIGKYFPHTWIAFRPFYVIHKDGGGSFTGIISSRFYDLNPINYWGVEINYGNSPDDRYVVSQSPDLLRLLTYKIKFEKNIALHAQGELKIAAGYAYEEYMTDLFRNRYLLEITYKYKF